MLVIINDSIVEKQSRKPELRTIQKHAGIFEIQVKVTQRGTGDRYTSKRYAADLTVNQVLAILHESPDMTLRIDELVNRELHVCESNPGKHYHLD